MRACAHAHTHERDVYTITEHCWRVCVKNEGGGKGVSFLLHRCSLSLYLRLNTTHTHTHTHAYLSSRTVSQAPTLPSSTSTCYLPLSSLSSAAPSAILAPAGQEGRCPLGQLPASCREIDESEIPWRLQRGFWGGQCGGQAPSNTKQAELMGMLWRQRGKDGERGVRLYRCICLGTQTDRCRDIRELRHSIRYRLEKKGKYADWSRKDWMNKHQREEVRKAER